jgi:hypothetical protein
LTSLMMSSCCTLRLKRRRAFSSDSPSCSRTSANLITSPPVSNRTHSSLPHEYCVPRRTECQLFAGNTRNDLWKASLTQAKGTPAQSKLRPKQVPAVRCSKSRCAITFPRFSPGLPISRSGAFQTLLPLCGSPGIHRLKRPGYQREVILHQKHSFLFADNIPRTVAFVAT